MSAHRTCPGCGATFRKGANAWVTRKGKLERKRVCRQCWASALSIVPTSTPCDDCGLNDATTCGACATAGASRSARAAARRSVGPVAVELRMRARAYRQHAADDSELYRAAHEGIADGLVMAADLLDARAVAP